MPSLKVHRCGVILHLQGGHKLGILWTWKTQGILGNSVQPQGKIITNKESIFSSSLKYLCKIAFDWVMLLELMWNDPWWRSLLHLLFVAITYGKVSLWLWKSLETQGIFFSYFVATLIWCEKRKWSIPWKNIIIDCIVVVVHYLISVT